MNWKFDTIDNKTSLKHVAAKLIGNTLAFGSRRPWFKSWWGRKNVLFVLELWSKDCCLPKINSWLCKVINSGINSSCVWCHQTVQTGDCNLLKWKVIYSKFFERDNIYLVLYMFMLINNKERTSNNTSCLIRLRLMPFWLGLSLAITLNELHYFKDFISWLICGSLGTIHLPNI